MSENNTGYGQYAYTNAMVEPPLDQPWYGIDFMNAIKRFFKKYAVFSGRASRGEFWWPYLVFNIVYFVFSSLTSFGITYTSIQSSIDSFETSPAALTVTIFSTILTLALLIPCIAVAVRRLHDTNRSGWFLLIPVLLCVVTVVSALIALFSFAIMLGAEILPDATLSSDAVAVTMIGMAVLAAVAGLAGTIVFIIFMAARSNPLGARFDKNATYYGM